MKPLRFLVFLIFNLAYQDGKKEENDPYFNTALVMLLFEFFIVLLGIDLLSLFIDFDIFNTFESFFGSGKSLVIVVFALLTLPNYYFFIKKKRFDRYYNEFKDDPINTKKNRKIGYICLILYMPIMLELAILFKS